MKSPVFIFSLPRSGSTLLQRLLASHEKIETTAEPWLLLPLIYAMRENGVFTEYSHIGSYMAMQDFFQLLPEGEDEFLKAISGAVSELYRKANPSDAYYFLDKTPRYGLICDEIIRSFPDAKFIFLWRNPLAVIASMMRTWSGGHWNLYQYEVDLYKSMPQMLGTFQKRRDMVLDINYEELIANPRDELNRIGTYLELTFSDDVLEEFSSVAFNGAMGDSSGTDSYQSISIEPLEKWKAEICNPWRKWWCKKYLRWLGNERLEIMGYDLHHLLSELEGVPFGLKYLLSDLLRAFGGWVFNAVGAFFLEKKWTKLRG